MKRRDVLKNLGLGVTAGVILPSWLASCSSDEPGPEVKYDGVVGIVGAGAAGLAVADYLIAKGVNVKIFEASGRVGGRVRSIKPSDPIYNELAADFHVELGADRIFGTNSEMGSIIKLLKVPTTSFREAPISAQDYYIINGEYFTQAEAELRPDFAALKTFRETGLAAYTGGGTVQSAAATTGDMQGILNSWLGNAYGSSVDRMDANAMGEALALIEHDKKEFVLTVNPISDVLTSKYNKTLKHVQLNSAVKNVTVTGDVVQLTILNPVTSAQTTVEVSKLVVTSPISVLKDSSLISFTPALPASKLAAMSRIGMDASIRIILEFTRNDFFKKPVGSGPQPAFIYGGVECPAYFFPGSGRSSKNLTLSLTINGSKAEELRALATDDERIQHVLDEMDVVFDGKARANIRKRFPEDGGTIISVVKDWASEPYILGGQSYPLPGGTNEDRVTLAEPVNDKLFFAGEATDITGEFGTISGALKSGERAAEEVVAAIRAENES